MRFLEKDEIGIVQKAAKRFDIAPTTVRRIGNKLGRTVSCHYQVHISEIHATKRVAYADKQLGQDHFRKCWADHTKLTVPPEPNRHRLTGSRLLQASSSEDIVGSRKLSF